MKWSSAVSVSRKAEFAVREATGEARKALKGLTPDIAFLYVSPHFHGSYEWIAKTTQELLNVPTLVGCVGGGVTARGREVEDHSAVSLLCGVLPGVNIKPFQAQQEDMPDLDSSPQNWRRLLGVPGDVEAGFVLMADPYSLSIENFLLGLDFAYPKSPKIGGLASGGSHQGENVLFIDGKVLRSGLVGVAVYGNVQLDTLVAQGCKPVGPEMRVTACERNVLMGLEEIPPLQMITEIFKDLPVRDQKLAEQALFLGIASDSGKFDLLRGDYLVRNVMGIDPQRGYIAVGAPLRIGQKVQLHLRDNQSSHDDLEEVFSNYTARTQFQAPNMPESQGVLQFSCMGRGKSLFQELSHDAQLFEKRIGSWPSAGFFCNGEIGPVGSVTHVHGYTSCFGIFRPKS